MFVRRYYATDESDPDSNATPVAMPTDLVSGSASTASTRP